MIGFPLLFLDKIFIVLAFEATPASHLVVDSAPAIFPPVEMKDHYDRCVLMICNEDSARVMEINLVVLQSPDLADLGGYGCLLRYRSWEPGAVTTAEAVA